jgi:acyl-CoA thioesterase
MNFDDVLAAGKAGTELMFTPDWAQGRATFGGIIAALVFDKMEKVVAPGRAMRSMQVSFVGPVTPDVPVEIEADILREGKAVSQVQGRIVQEGEVKLVCLASFGGDRESVVAVSPLPAPDAAPVSECQGLPYIKGMTPEFTQHIDMRWAFGAFPFSGRGGRDMGGWMQFRETPAEITDAHIVALVDAWPPAVLPHLKGPVPASSLNWALDIMRPRLAIKPGDWLLYRASIDQAGSGYGHTQAGIWTEKGELVALSRQTVTVFG